MTDIGQLQRDAGKAQAALSAAQAAEATKQTEAAEQRRRRSVAWAFRTVSLYPSRQAEANGHVTAALAAFSVAVATDYASSPNAYLAIARAMAAANGVAAEYVEARHILRTAGVITAENAGHRPDPVGYLYAPHPPSSLPTFADLAASALEAARAAAFRLPPATDDPGSFAGEITEAERQAVIGYEWTFSQEGEHLVGVMEQHPAAFARIPAAQQAEARAYLAGRQARGYDAPLPQVVVSTTGHDEAPDFAPNDSVRIRLYSDGAAPRPR